MTLQISQQQSLHTFMGKALFLITRRSYNCLKPMTDIPNQQFDLKSNFKFKLNLLLFELSLFSEFTLSSFCDSVDMTNFSRLKVLRLDANEINARDIPAEAAYCLRRVAFIDV